MSKKYLTKVEAERVFKTNMCSVVNKDDKSNLRLEWILFIDSLCKNGDISQKQYESWDLPNFLK